MGIRKNLETEKKLYIHYGSRNFDKTKFKDVRNIRDWTKPEFGLWGSPVESDNSWKNWCLDNEYGDIDDRNSFCFCMRGRKVFEIECMEDIQKLPRIKLPEKLQKINGVITEVIDFERAAREYSAIDIIIEDVIKILPGYDCDSVIVLDDRNLVINYEYHRTNHPLTLYELLPVKTNRAILHNIEFSWLTQMPEGKHYFYTKQPDPRYGAKTIVACYSDGRLIESCGYTEEEAKELVSVIRKIIDTEGLDGIL